MNFKEWMKISEVKSSVRYRPSNSLGALNQGFLRGSAATYGHTDSPDPFEKGVTALATGLGSSYRKSLEDDSGLEVQGVGRILNPPEIEESENLHYNYLPLQLPQISNKEIKISTNSNKIFKDILNLPDEYIRTVTGPNGIDKGIELENSFTLFYENEETGQANGDYNVAKQFTTALIYKKIISGLTQQGEIEKYKLEKTPEIVGEEMGDRNILLVWFKFESKKIPQIMKDGKPETNS